MTDLISNSKDGKKIVYPIEDDVDDIGHGQIIKSF